MTAPVTFDPTTWSGFGEITVTAALSPDDQLAAAGWLEAEHFLGSFKAVGHSLMHIIRENGEPVAVIQWAACAYHLKDREAWIGWDALTCARRRNLVVNNVRFLVREAARRPNLASKALAHSVKALAAHWSEHFGYQPLLCETFTDIESHAGTCYKAAGWTPLGLTAGSARQRAEFYVRHDRPKKLWVKALRPDARERLCAKTLAPEHAAGQTEGKGAPLPLKASMLVPLAQALRAVPDPRARNRQHLIAPLLCLIALGLLCGGTNLNAIVRHIRRLTPAQLRLLGIRGKKISPQSRHYSYKAPDYETFRQLLCRVDLDAFARVLSTWLSAHRGALPAQLALDGKKVRGTLGTIVTLCDVETDVPVALAATTQEGGEQACARELLRREDTVLLNATVSLDALYTNADNARLIVQEKGGDYIISVKDNQPALAAHTADALRGTPFFESAGGAQRHRAAARHRDLRAGE
jgi:hypothetical protein